MAFSKFWLIYWISTVLFIIAFVNSSKLNVPRVLLPIFNDISPSFVLEATEGGCYKWSTTRADVIQLIPIDPNEDRGCSTKVLVSAVTKEATRNIAVVLAEEIMTKQNLRCDVIVDVINKLSVVTTTKELFMEEAPEDFEVIAFDEQGNEFSTLEGIEFEWNIVPLGSKKDVVLRYIPFKDSTYETPINIADLEKIDKKGYKILLEGVKTGSAKITVRLPYPEYKDVPACEVQLMVVANLLLTPTEVYMMPYDDVPITVFVINNGRMQELNLKKSQYYLESENSKVAYTSKGSNIITAGTEGVTKVILKDKNVGKDEPGLKFPAVSIHVVLPDYMVLNILPHKNWAVLVNDYHDIVAEVYSSNDHKLYIGSKVQAKLNISSEYYVSDQSLNGTWATGCGVKPGLAPVEGTLLGVNKGKITFPNIVAKAELQIYPRITIEPSDVVLPWDAEIKPRYEIDLVAKGGDGTFLWVSSNNSIGVVSQTGHVSTFSQGFFEVSAVMLRNHHNRQNAKILIVPPSRLEIVEYIMEAEIGSTVYLHVALYADQIAKDGKRTLVPFTKCQDIPFQVRQTDMKFKQNKSAIIQPVGISCGNIGMLGMNVGTTKVTITYDNDGETLEDSVTISAFRPLTYIQPKHEVVLAVGTSINLVFTGGPRPLIGRLSEFKRVAVSENEAVAQPRDVTQFHSIPGEDFTVIEVLCRKLGEADITLTISNNPASTNCKTTTSTWTVRVACGKPRRITIQPDLKLPDVTACPMDLSSGKGVVQSSRPTSIDVSVFDDCGNRFLNISSLNLRWFLEPALAGTLESPDSVFPNNITVGTVPIADRSFQLMKPKILIGAVNVNVTIVGYLTRILKANKITPEWPEFTTDEDRHSELVPISSSITLTLVEDHAIKPTLIKLLSHFGNKEAIKVTQGSGYFEVSLSDENVVNVNYIETSRTLEITPLRSGKVIIQLLDLCLVSQPAILTVNVLSVGRIEVEMVEKVEIGKCVPCLVRLFDENDGVMEITDPEQLDLEPDMERRIVNIHRNVNFTGDVGEVGFIVTGIEVGETKLTFTASSNDQKALSNTINLEVFEPLRIQPRNGTVLIGTSLQMQAMGGPSQAEVIYNTTMSKQVFAVVTPEGYLTGEKAGKAVVFAQARGIHPFTGQTVIYSNDTVEVKIIQLQAVKIVSPLTRFAVGSTVPFWVMGVPDVSPLVLGTIDDPPSSMQWKVDDTLLADLTGVFHPLGVSIRRVDRVTLKLTGLQAGKTKVFVNVTVPGKVAGFPKQPIKTLIAFLDIEIVDKFEITYPEYFFGVNLLMAPHSQIQLKTNLDNIAEITYSLEGVSGQPSTELQPMDDERTIPDPLVSVSSTGLVKSYGDLGHAILEVVATDSRGVVQKLYYVVEVKHVTYMSIIAHAEWKININSQVRSVPLGTSFWLKMNFHDSLGGLFHAGPSDLKVRTSRSDLIKMNYNPENSSLFVESKKPGSTVLKVYMDGLEAYNMQDFVKIHVEQLVRPDLEHLTVGDTVCLWTPVVSRSHQPGTWRSSDTSIVEINPALDIAFVIGSGTVVLTHSLLASAPIQLPVYPVSEIEFLPPPRLVVTNGQRDEVTRILLVLQSEVSKGLKTNNLIQGWRCRTDVRKMVRPHGFNCFMKFDNSTECASVNDIFNISSSWVPETGQYACKLVSNGVNNTKIATLRTNLTIWAVTEDETVCSTDLTAEFIPGVYVPKEIFLAERTNVGELRVIGLPEVLAQITVLPADSSIIFVDKGKILEETSKSFQVQLLDYHWRLADKEDMMGIIVKSPLTKQSVPVMVKVTGKLTQFCGRSPISSFLQTYKYSIIVACASLGVFLLTFYFYSHFMQPVVNVNVSAPRERILSSTMPPSASMGPKLSPPSHRCAAILSRDAQLMRRNGPETSGNLPGLSSYGHICGCSCTCAADRSRSPIYGDPSSFYTSTPAEARRNSRRM